MARGRAYEKDWTTMFWLSSRLYTRFLKLHPFTQKTPAAKLTAEALVCLPGEATASPGSTAVLQREREEIGMVWVLASIRIPHCT